MPSGLATNAAAPMASPPLVGFPNAGGVAAFAAALTQTAPASPDESSPLFFDGVSEDSEFLRSSSDSGSSVSASQYAARPKSSSGAIKIARPPNAWILYRSTKLAEWKSKNPELYAKGGRSKAERGNRPTQASMSKQIADMWREEPQEVKDHFHNEAVMRSVMHAVENPGERAGHLSAWKSEFTVHSPEFFATTRRSPGYRFNPNKGRKKKEKKARAPNSSSGSPSFSPYTPPVHHTSPFGHSLDSPSPSLASAPYTSVLQLSQELAEATATLPTFGGHQTYDVKPPASSHSATSPSSYRRPSIQAQWAQIFGEETTDYTHHFYGPASSASSVPSPPWTGSLLPSLTIDDVDHKPSTASSVSTAPVTPNSEQNSAFCASYSDYAPSEPALDTTFAFNFSEPVPSMPTTDLSLSVGSSAAPSSTSPFMAAPETMHASNPAPPHGTDLQGLHPYTSTSGIQEIGSSPQPQPQSLPEWWPYRHYRGELRATMKGMSFVLRVIVADF